MENEKLFLGGGLLLALGESRGDGLEDDRDRLHGIVVRRDAEREILRIRVAVADAIERNIQLPCFTDGHDVADSVHNDDGVGKLGHLGNTRESGVELCELLPELRLLLLCVLLHFSGLERALKIQIVLETALHVAPVREQSRSTSW